MILHTLEINDYFKFLIFRVIMIIQFTFPSTIANWDSIIVLPTSRYCTILNGRMLPHNFSIVNTPFHLSLMGSAYRPPLLFISMHANATYLSLCLRKLIEWHECVRYTFSALNTKEECLGLDKSPAISCAIILSCWSFRNFGTTTEITIAKAKNTERLRLFIVCWGSQLCYWLPF